MSIAKIILDTDPGGDDIFAFLWLLSLVKQRSTELIAITTADGNVAANQTFISASQLLTLMELNAIEVGRGVPINASENAAHIHGADGMGNLSHTLPSAAHSFDAARFSDDIILDALNAHPGEITLVAIAPLTNLASAETKQPGILKKAKEIVIMGGAFYCPGNITPHAEFNIWFNSHAAKIVFNSRNDLVILPLDVTTKLIFTREMAQTVSQINPNNKLSTFLMQLCEFMTSTALKYRETKGISGFLVHDAAAIAYLFYPETLMLRRSCVRVETKGEWTIGQTLIEDLRSINAESNAWVALQIDQTRFFTHFIEDLKTLIED